MFGRGFLDPYDLYDEPFAPWGHEAISQRAVGKLNEAKELIHNFIALADTSSGPVTEEVVPFHLVAYAQKQLRDHLKQWGMTPCFRFDNVPKRKSKVCYTSVTVTAASKSSFLRDNPGQVAIAQAAAQAAAEVAAEVAAKGRKKKGNQENEAGSTAPAAKRSRP